MWPGATILVGEGVETPFIPQLGGVTNSQVGVAQREASQSQMWPWAPGAGGGPEFKSVSSQVLVRVHL